MKTRNTKNAVSTFVPNTNWNADTNFFRMMGESTEARRVHDWLFLDGVATEFWKSREFDFFWFQFETVLWFALHHFRHARHYGLQFFYRLLELAFMAFDCLWIVWILRKFASAWCDLDTRTRRSTPLSSRFFFVVGAFSLPVVAIHQLLRDRTGQADNHLQHRKFSRFGRLLAKGYVVWHCFYPMPPSTCFDEFRQLSH